MITFLAKSLIYFYKYFISPLLPNSCRFTTSCSHYALDAIKMHGVLAGGILSIKRILSCHPFSKKDIVDEVPTDITNISPFKYLTNIKSDKNIK
jgi:putative membrane protein insertion efficiency factor